MAKLACRSVAVSTPKSIRENLIQQVASILASYRKNCTNAPARGQFILPETLKLLQETLKRVVSDPRGTAVRVFSGLSSA